jgi:hypothetical protein
VGGGVEHPAVECTAGSHWTQIPRRGPFKFLTLCKEPIECTDIYGLQEKTNIGGWWLSHLITWEEEKPWI